MSITNIVPCLAVTALLIVVGAPPASAATAAAAEYCVEVAPGSVGGIPIYPGGKYCVPGP